MSDRRISELNSLPVHFSASELDGSAKELTGERVAVGSGEDRQSLVEGSIDSRTWLGSLTDYIVDALSHFASFVISPVTSFLIARAVDKAIEKDDLQALAALVNDGASARRAGIGALLIAARDGNAVETKKWLSLMKEAGMDLNAEISPQGVYLLNEALMRGIQANKLDVVCLVVDQFNQATSPQDIHRLLGLMTWAISNSGQMNSRIDQRMEQAPSALKQLKRTPETGNQESGNREKCRGAGGKIGPSSATLRELGAEAEEAKKIAAKLVEKFHSLGLDLTQKNMQGRTLLGLATDVGSPGVLSALLEKISSTADPENPEDQGKRVARLMTEWNNAIQRAEARANAKKNAALRGHWVDARHIPSNNVEVLARAILGLKDAQNFDQQAKIVSMLSLKAIPDFLPLEGNLSIANGLIKAGISVSADERKILKNWLPAVALHSAEGFIDFCAERDLAGLMDLFAKGEVAEH